MNDKMMHQLAYVLLFVGGLNWGLVGLLNLNLVAALGLPAMVERVVYLLVGAAAVYLVSTHRGYCAHCMEKSKKKR